MCLDPEPGVEGSVIGCKARNARARSGGLNCPPNHPRWDVDASFKTGQLRARKRLTT